MITVYINENLSESKVRKLFEFAANISNTVSLARYYYGRFSRMEFDAIQNEYKDLILEEDRTRRLHYRNDTANYRERLNHILGIKDVNAANQYFDELFNQDLISLNHFSVQEGKMPRFTTNNNAYLYTRYTRISPVTRGPVFELCYFDLSLLDKELILPTRLFAYPIYINEVAFEDITFYGDNRVVLAICAHEQYAYLRLTEGEYRCFCGLNIMHEVNDCTITEED
jgi:hypothetical protein